MAVTPGSMDFSKLAKEASATLDKEPVVESKVKVAGSEGGVPAPSNEQVAETLETQNENSVDNENETEVQNLSANQEEEETSQNEGQNQEEVKEEILALPDNAKVKVKIDGVEQVVSYGEYKDLLRKNATVTQRMQQFAQSREEFNLAVQQTLQQLEAREANLRQQAEKKDPLYDTILTALKGQVQPKPRDPNEIVTLGDVQKEREALMQQVESLRKQDRQEFEQQLVNAAQQANAQRAQNEARQAYLSGLNSILSKDDYKVLNDVIPNFSASVMFHVKNSGAQNLEEALELSEDFVKDRLEALKKLTVASNQAQQKKAVKQKMESNDGATATIVKGEKSQAEKAQQYVGKNGKLDWKAMQKAALAQINSMN